MREYASVTLNMIEYTGIYPKKQSTEFARILNVSEFWLCLMQHITQGVFTNYWAVAEKETYSEYCQTFKMERFAKTIMPECRCATRNFSGQGAGGLWNWGTSIKILSKTSEKEASQGNISEFFLLDTLQTIF